MQKIILVWAGWTGLSWVAWILHDLWFGNLICIDAYQSQLTDKLISKWIKVILWHGKITVNKEDIVIYSAATKDSIEVITALNFPRNIKKPKLIFNYFEFLWEVSKYFNTIWIAGTNGKSSTTSLWIYTATKLLPTFWLGILWALVPDLNWDNYIINKTYNQEIKTIFNTILSNKEIPDFSLIKKYYFFVEACEYKRHFLNLNLDYAIITNTNLDHTDYFKDQDDYNAAFQEMSRKVKNKIFTPNTIKIHNFNFTTLFGNHWNINWSLILNLFKELDPKIETKQIISTIQNFNGLRRRMEHIGENNQWALIFSDYWHIAESITIGKHSLKEKYPNKELTIIFQPHQIQRIIAERDKFKEIIPKYDNIFIYDLYAARENLEKYKNINIFKNLKTITKSSIWNLFAKETNWIYISEKQELINLINKIQKNNIIILYTAWDLDYIVRNHITTK